MPENIFLKCVEVCIGVCVREEGGLRLCDKAMDASDVTRLRGYEQRGRRIQKQGTREEYSDGDVTESLAAVK